MLRSNSSLAYGARRRRPNCRRSYSNGGGAPSNGFGGQVKRQTLDLSHVSYRYKKALTGKPLQQHVRHKLGLAYTQQHRFSHTWSDRHVPTSSALAANLAFRRQVRLYSAARLAGGHPRAPSFAAMPVAQHSAELSTVVAKAKTLRATQPLRKGIGQLSAPPVEDACVVYRKNYRLAAHPLYRFASGGSSSPRTLSRTSSTASAHQGASQKSETVNALQQYAALGQRGGNVAKPPRYTTGRRVKAGGKRMGLTEALKAYTQL